MANHESLMSHRLQRSRKLIERVGRMVNTLARNGRSSDDAASTWRLRRLAAPILLDEAKLNLAIMNPTVAVEADLAMIAGLRIKVDGPIVAVGKLPAKMPCAGVRL